MRAGIGQYTMDNTMTPPPSPVSHDLTELLDIIDSANRPSTSTAAADSLIKFMKKNRSRPEQELSPKNLATALRRSLLDVSCNGLNAKLILMDWLTERIKNTARELDAIKAIIHGVSMVVQQLSLDRKELERWIPLLDGYCLLTQACVDHTQKLSEEDIDTLLQDSSTVVLASIVFDPNAFKHKDKQKTQAHKDWIGKILELTKSFLAFVLNRVVPLKHEDAINATIQICNVLCRFASDSKSDFRLLSNNFVAIMKLIPHCRSPGPARLNYSAIVSLLCRGVLDALATVAHATSQNTNTGSMAVKTALALTRFYAIRLPAILKLIGSELAKQDEEAIQNLNMVKLTLASLRCQVLSNKELRKSHTSEYQETTKTISNLEEQVVSSLMECLDINDRQRFALLCYLASPTGSRVVLGTTIPLTDRCCYLGRLYLVMSIMVTMDEFSPDLQLQLYPVQNPTAEHSLVSTLLNCVKELDLQEFVPPYETVGTEDQDLYLTVILNLCIFAHLVQPRQFVKLQLDMTGMILGRPELESCLGRDWWVCMSKELGQDFTVRQIFTFMELLELLPVCQVSRTIAALVGNLIRNLDTTSEDLIVQYIGVRLKNDSPTLLTCFPFHCFSKQSLDELVLYCNEQWRTTCGLMEDDRLVVDAFYATYRYIACIKAILSGPSGNTVVIEDLKRQWTDWSRTQICGAPQLVGIVMHNRTHVKMVFYTVTHLLSFLGMMHLEFQDTIEILEACLLLQEFKCDIPLEMSIAAFIETCDGLQHRDFNELKLESLTKVMDKLFKEIMANPRCVLAHETLARMSWVESCMPGMLTRHVSTSMLQRSRVYQEVKKGKRVADRGRDALWRTVEDRLELSELEYQRLSSDHTIENLQRIGSGTSKVVTPEECLTALTVAKRKLQELFNDREFSKISPAMKAMMTADVLQLQQLTETDESTSSTAMAL
ncbi:hypothetical protein BG004_004684 [Podila humilis]|nr:hypothetical protein BG004_004684 [Podila humilis]